MTSSPKDDNDSNTLQTLARGAAVLNLLYELDNFSLKQAADELKLSTTIVFRLLRTWVASGYLHYDSASKKYGPGLMLMRLAAKAHVSAGLPEIEARLTSLSRRIDQTCSCGVLAGRYALYVARVLANKMLTYQAEVGKTLPAFATSMGQVLLAFEPRDRLLQLFPEPSLPRHTDFTLTDREKLFILLEGIKQKGYAINQRQLTPWVAAVAVPVHNKKGEMVAAFSTAGPAEQFSNEAIQELYLPALLEAAKEPVELSLLRPQLT